MALYDFSTMVKSILPITCRRTLRRVLHYIQRVGRWVVILWHLRGLAWRDELILVYSALLSPVFALRTLLAWQDPVLLKDCLVNVPGFGIFSLRKHSDDLWHVLPARERAIVNCIKSKLKEGEISIDAGANVGIYIVLASNLVGQTGRVLAVEMMPDTADRLRRHMQMNALSNVSIIRAALSDRSGQKLQAEVEKGKYGQASIAKRSFQKNVESVIVDAVTLDEISSNLGHVQLMKMDLEGAEMLALLGATEMLTRTEAVIFERRGANRSKEGPLENHFLNAGFELTFFDGNNVLACERRVEAA